MHRPSIHEGDANSAIGEEKIRSRTFRVSPSGPMLNIWSLLCSWDLWDLFLLRNAWLYGQNIMGRPQLFILPRKDAKKSIFSWEWVRKIDVNEKNTRSIFVSFAQCLFRRKEFYGSPTNKQTDDPWPALHALVVFSKPSPLQTNWEGDRLRLLARVKDRERSQRPCKILSSVPLQANKSKLFCLFFFFSFG